MMQFTRRLLILIAAAIMFGAPVHAETSPCDWKQPVEKWDGNQTDLNACASEKLKHSDDTMNRLYKKKLDALTDAKNEKRFREAQRAWIAFRDKACLYEVGDQENSGSIWQMENALCLSNLTDQRIENLKSYLACASDGCPQ